MITTVHQEDSLSEQLEFRLKVYHKAVDFVGRIIPGDHPFSKIDFEKHPQDDATPGCEVTTSLLIRISHEVLREFAMENLEEWRRRTAEKLRREHEGFLLDAFKALGCDSVIHKDLTACDGGNAPTEG